MAKLYPSPQPVGEILEKFSLTKLAKRRVSRLSGGQRRRVAVALAFVGSPALIMLDEPTAGLDIEVRQDIIQTIKQEFAAKKLTAIVTSHYLEDIEALANNVAVLKDGSFAFQGPISELVDQGRQSVVSLRSNAVKQIRDLLLEGDELQADEDLIEIKTANADTLVSQLHSAKVEMRELSIRRRRLEEAFIGLIREGDKS